MTFQLHKSQMQAFESNARTIYYLGDMGSGKTTLGSYWSIDKIKNMTDGELGLIASYSYEQLCDSTLKNFYNTCREAGIKLIPEQVPKGAKPFTIKVWNGKFWVEILCRSLDNYETFIAVELSWAWVDDCDSINPLKIINEKLRCGSEQLLVTTYPNSIITRPSKDLRREIIYGTTYDNEENLTEGFLN